eukprot:TRINITY_DN29961_c0_g1_i1.p1 TRINITY_DN29961_c0_g1~~TRINITY_DN29961_c0_g1_i1.p1  ORF type:complete len:200 (-),score=41.74 TRINITY_DN29961_c0_g1_i1:319-918(-)
MSKRPYDETGLGNKNEKYKKKFKTSSEVKSENMKALKLSKKKFQLTPDLLLGSDGFTKLSDEITKLCKDWSTDKGSEKSNLNRFLGVYVAWYKGLAPTLEFDDFVSKTEDLSNNPLIQETLSKMNENTSSIPYPKEVPSLPLEESKGQKNVVVRIDTGMTPKEEEELLIIIEQRRTEALERRRLLRLSGQRQTQVGGSG